MSEPVKAVATNFIRNIINDDLKNGKNDGRVHTRFPPEPNGYLHIGHAKAICLNFGIARDYQGLCNLRFDDTNPAKESEEFSRAIEEDLRWLGFEWHNTPFHASDYFEDLYRFAEELIGKGLAYVDEQDAEAMRASRGTLTEPGTDSPCRNRPVAENLDLFRRMRAGEFDDGSMVLRAKIDMASANLNMRDPVIYRIRRQHHIRTKDAWVIYPMYDFTHGISDALEGITHSLCTLEFEDHRPLYNWFLDNITIDCHPQQIEFARLSLAYTITSKRKLSQLVTEGLVSGWDDPRMPTLTGIRRRGFTPRAIRRFCELIGVTKKNTVTDMSVLEDCVRQDLDAHAPRAMAVLDPVRVVIENWPEDKVEMLTAPCHPKTDLGNRELPMTREVYIDRADFRESANKKFKRMVLDGEVRLRNGYVIKCLEARKDDDGNITELRCSYDPDTLGVNPEGRKVRGVIHWVSASHSLPAQVRLYDRLFKEPNPGSLPDFHEAINPGSLQVLDHCRVEAGLAEAQPEQHFQFEREGYFCVDRHDSKPGHLVFNRTVSLRDSWAKLDQES